MDQIRKQIDRARRRLRIELFLRRLVACWFVALLGAAIAIAVPKFVAIETLPPNWDALWLGGALAIGALFAFAWTWLRGQSSLDAAMEIDRRFDLKERVASTLSLPPEAAATPAGQALMHDAERAVRRLDIDQRFRIQLGRRAWLPLAPAFAALALTVLVADQQAQSSVNANAVLNPKAIEASATALRKRMTEIAKKDVKKDLKETQALLLEMEKEVERLAAQPSVDRKQALVKFNSLAKQLAERRDRIGGDNELRKQLEGMKDLGRGPADKMVEAMKSGDWEQAKQELQKLQEQLKSGKLDAASKEQLAAQLKQFERQLSEAAAKRGEAIENLKKQVEAQKQKGDLAKAGELQEKLDRLTRQQQQASKLEEMAQKMALAKQQLEKGDQKGAAETMEQMSKEMQQMQAEAEQKSTESEMLDMAMEQLELAKDSMLSEEADGGEMSQRKMAGSRNGRGIGKGSAYGVRPEDPIDAAYRDTRVKQNPGRGPAIVTGEADGPTIRGDVREAIQEEMAAGESEDADAMVIEQLPRTQRENAEDYFNRLREGE
jgi:hypothetical protein